ncbi:hypothetical protein niasHS_009601 [Heterodera schachtii]|uniref:Uncharacterized protein n=1 Tax=Heterodera schachtii TaxID=97005 RepID=A0ABD2JBK1_HETSC
MLRRQELCGELQSRSLRISRLLQILLQHAADAKNVKQSYIKVVNQKKKQLKERADALESKKMENEELTLENWLLRERITKLEGMVRKQQVVASWSWLASAYANPTTTATTTKTTISGADAIKAEEGVGRSAATSVT